VAGQIQITVTVVNAAGDEIDALNSKLSDLQSAADGASSSVDGVSGSLGDTGSAADSAAASVDNVGASANTASGTFAELTMGVSGAINIFNTAVGVIQGVVDQVLQLADAGVQADRTLAGLNAISDGQTPQYLNAMTSATGGLISQVDLAKDAYMGLSTGIATSSDKMAEIASDGAKLGLDSPFMGNAQAGVNALEMGLEGNTRGLKQLGIDMNEVKTVQAEFMTEGVDKATALQDAILQVADVTANKLGDAFNGTGSKMDKLSADWQNAWTDMGKVIAPVADFIANDIDKSLKTVEVEISVFEQQIVDLANAAGKSGPDLLKTLGNIVIPGSSPDHPITLPGAHVGGGNDDITPSNAGTDTGGDYGGGGGVPPAPTTPSFGPITGGTTPLSTYNEITPDVIANTKAYTGALQQTTTTTQTAATAQDAYNAALAKRNSINSESKAFGLNTNAFDQQGESALQTALTAKDHGKLTAADQAVIDAYKISTGEATDASLSFDSAMTKLNASIADGHTPATVGAQDILSLTKAAQDGTQAAQDYIKAMDQWLTTGKTTITNDNLGGADPFMPKTSQSNVMPTYTDPLAAGGSSQTNGIANSLTQVNALQTTLNALPAAATTAATTMSTAFGNTPAAIGLATTAIDTGLNTALAASVTQSQALLGFLNQLPGAVKKLQQAAGSIVLTWSVGGYGSGAGMSTTGFVR
jgi:hypothetical protein